jgi:hypothetical protein
MKVSKSNKHFRKIAATILIAVTFFSCKTNIPDDEIKTINVLEPDGTELSISEIADDIKYIPLANDSALAYIMSVARYNGDYFVKDNKSKFLRFNEKGELINPIGNRGRGPGEYRYVSDFVIHPETGNIFVTGGKENQILCYSPEGKFLKSIPITMKHPSSIGLSNGNLFLFYLDGAQHNEENMELIDTDGKIIKSYANKYKFERGRAVIGFSGECVMYQQEGKLHFKEIFSDTIFYLDGQKMVPEMILNSGDKRFTPEKRTTAIKELSADPRSTSESMVNSVTQNNLFETDNFLFYGYGYDKKGRMLIYNKTTGQKTEIDPRAGVKNDWDGGPNIQLKMKKDDNTLFSWINAIDLKTYVASDEFKNSTPKYSEKKKQLEKLANSLNENDNPVLMLVKLKE